MIDQEIIHNQCLSDDLMERIKGLEQLRKNFSFLPDIQQAWSDLIELINDEDDNLRFRALYILDSVFSQVPDKQKAWNDLTKLIIDNENTNMIYRLASTLKSAYPQVPDKQQAWNDLIRLANNQNDGDIRFFAVSTIIFTLNSAYSYILDKQQMWNDLIKLINSKDWNVRFFAASALDSAYSYMPDKRNAWNDLIRLATNEDSMIRAGAADALGSAFSQTPDRQKAWNILHILTTDRDKLVRCRAANALGLAFSHLPYEQEALNDLIKLTNDEESLVRHYANSSLGKVSIFNASKAEKEEDYREELENAIKFFELATIETSHFDYLNFCLPFYRSLHTIIFKKREAKGEVDNYLAEAKAAVKGSKSRETLFEAAQNLANALNEVQNLENIDLESKKKELNFYRKYCEKATELINDTEEVSPLATEVLRKGIPILDRKLKSLLEEIQEKAKTACKETKGTITEEVACAVSKEVQKWEIGTQEEMSSNVESLIATLKSRIPRVPENQYIFDKIQQIIEQKDIAKQYSIVSSLISSIPIIKFENLNKIEDNSENSCEYNELKEKDISPDTCDYSMVDAGLNIQIEMLREHCGSIKEEKRTQFFEMLEETKKMDVKGKLESIPKIYEFAANNRIFPFIEKISISDRINKVVKIAAVQLYYKLSEGFPYEVKTEYKEVVKQKVLNVLNIALREKVDILCLPELCIGEDFVPDIRNNCREMIVVAGTYYDNGNHNLCKIVMNSNIDIPPQLKIVPSDFEKSDRTEQRMVPGKKIINLYETKFGKFAVLICRDFGNFTSTLKGKVDLIFVPSYNSANRRFHDYAHLHVEDSPSYIIISNTAEYGGTAIFGRIRDTFYPSLELKGYKQKGDKTFKLCEIKKDEEGMIIADFNLLHKSFLIPAPIDSDEDIIPVENIQIIPV